MLKRIDLTRDYKKHQAEYQKAIQEVCEQTAFSGGAFADRFDRQFAQFVGVTPPSENSTSAS